MKYIFILIALISSSACVTAPQHKHEGCGCGQKSASNEKPAREPAAAHVHTYDKD